jgi:hypothetical protein
VKSKLILKLVALGGMTLALFAMLALASAARPGVVSATANPLPALLSCPNVDGSTEPAVPPDPTKLGKVTVADILSVIQHFGKNHGLPGYTYLDDLVTPYNSTSPTNTGQETVADILAVIQKFGQYCPLVDTQIAKATRALSEPAYSDKLCDPALTTPMLCGGTLQFLTEDATFLATKGYFRGTIDVPGQGVHYVNLSLWDGVFNPARPEGLVYTDGKLSAELYVVDGGVVGWGAHAAGPCTPCPGAEHGIDLEGAADGPQCSPACSWAGGYDGWHVHHYLCTVHIGHTVAFAYPGALFPSIGDTQAHCQSQAASGGSGTQCPVSMTSADVPCYTWGKDVGWMGHLWNWLPNANLIPDIGTSGTNGRFADCYPDTDGWGPFNCPA